MTKPPKKSASPPAPGLPLARPVKLPRPRIVKEKPADLLKHAKIEFLATSSLKTDPDNARTHSERQLTQLMAAIKKFGWLVPLVVDADLMILAGHARYEVAKRMNLAQVPCIRADHLTDVERTAFGLAENRIAERAGWNPKALERQLDKVFNAGIDLETIGFSTADLHFGPAVTTQTDDDPEPPVAAFAISRDGDVWGIGSHVVVCGDSREPEVFEAGLRGRLADMVFGDGPYNVPVDGFVRGKRGKTRFREFAFASGEMSPAEFTAFQRSIFRNCVRFSKAASIHFQCMDWRHIREILDAADGVYTEFKQLIVWNKESGGQGAFYRSQFELIFVFKSGRGKHTNTFELGQGGRFRTNVWSYPGANALGKNRSTELASHATPKSIPMVMDAIRDCSLPGELVLDPFLGSGVTAIAAHRTGRVCVGIEVDPLYVDVALKRIAAVTGFDPILLGDGRTFDEIAAERSAAGEA